MYNLTPLPFADHINSTERLAITSEFLMSGLKNNNGCNSRETGTSPNSSYV